MDRRLKRIFAGGIILVIALSTTAGIGLGATTTPLQVNPETPTPTPNNSSSSNLTPRAGNSSGISGLPNATAGANTTTNESGNVTSAGNSGNGGGIISGAVGAVGSAVPSPGDWVGGILKWIHNDVREGVAGFINDFNFLLTGVLHPGNATDPTSWVNPDQPLWNAIWKMFGLSLGLSIPIHTYNFMMALDRPDKQSRQRRLKETGFSFAMSIIGPVVVGLLYGGTNILTQTLAPSGQELLATPKSVSKLGVGVVLGVVVSIANSGVIASGLAVIVVMQFILVFVAGTWPIWWGMRASSIGLFRSKGNFALSCVGVILLIRVVQALILRFLSWMPWGEVGPGSTLFLTVIIIVGLLVAMWGLPYYGVRKTTTAAGFALGMSFMPKNPSPSGAYSGAKSRYYTARSTVSRASDRASRSGQWAKQKASRAHQRAPTHGSSSSSSGGSESGSGSGTRSGTTAGHSSANSASSTSESGSSSTGSAASSPTRSRLTSASTGNRNLSRRARHISKRSNRSNRSKSRNNAATEQRSPGSRRSGTSSSND